MSEDKVVLRGDVWWISSGTNNDWEQNFGRPAVVVSGDVGNERMPTVIVAFVTTQPSKPSPVYPKVMFPDGERRVLANQIYTISKARFDRKICTLTESEMIRVGGALAVAMCIPQYQNSKVLSKEKTTDDIDTLKVEADMWRKMYEKTMDQLVELRVAADMSERTEQRQRPVIKQGVVEPDLGYEEEPKKPEPKKKSESPKKQKVEWDGVKVNVNTVPSASELKRRTGIAMNTALEIVKTREVVGKYETLNDLLALDKFGEVSMRRYGHMLTVGETELDVLTDGEPETEKKNIHG